MTMQDTAIRKLFESVVDNETDVGMLVNVLLRIKEHSAPDFSEVEYVKTVIARITDGYNESLSLQKHLEFDLLGRRAVTEGKLRSLTAWESILIRLENANAGSTISVVKNTS